MADVSVVEPQPLIVSLELAKKHLRVDHDEDDALIELLLTAAQGGDDGPASYAAGFDSPPAPIVAAVLLIIADLYARREAQTEVSSGSVSANPAVEALLAPYRVWRV